MAKILIVDDDVVNSQLYSNKLEHDGYDVELISNGQSASEKTGEKYDLILLDVMIPGVDGFSLLQSFRKGVNKQTPILMFTNLVSDDTKKNAQQHGATELLFKADTTPQALIAKIQGYVGKAAPAAAAPAAPATADKKAPEQNEENVLQEASG